MCQLSKMAVFGLTICLSFLVIGSVGIEVKTYIVVPDQSAKSCSSINQTECSLMYYASNLSEFFTEDNTVFLFKAGDHVLVNKTRVRVANISNIVFRGNNGNVSEVRVMCNGLHSGSFSFYNITNLTIVNLSFIRCSYTAVGFTGLTAVEIHFTHNLTMDNVYITETAGHGLALSDLYGNSIISYTVIEFSHNTSDASGGNFAFYCTDKYISQEDPMLTHSLYITHSSIINGTNSFYEVYPPSSGMYFRFNCQTKLNIVLDNIILAGNSGDKGGNMGVSYAGTSQHWTVSISILNSVISHGFAYSGGGLYLVAIANMADLLLDQSISTQGQFLTIKNTTFEKNTANYAGAGFYGRLHQNPGTAVGKLVFRNCTFKKNNLVFPSNDTQSHGGVGVHIVIYTLPEYIQRKIMFFKLEFSNCTFVRNRVLSKVSKSTVFRTGALYIENAQTISMIGCNFTENNCTGIAVINSNILFHGYNIIHGNTGYKGGGIFFCSGSMMHLYNGTRLTISENNATLFGGGIFVDNECSPAVSYCFFQVDNIAADNTTLSLTQVHLIHNNATAGTALYGGLIDNCILFDKAYQHYASHTPGKVFNATFHIQNIEDPDLSSISSDPMYIGFCEINSTSTTESLISNCPQTTRVHVTPGSIFYVSAVVMGQCHGLVTGIVDVLCLNESCNVPAEYYSQLIQHKTNKTKLAYSVIPSKGENITLELVAEDFYLGYPTYRYQPSYIHVTIEKCPLGFRKEDHGCVCLLSDTTCNITRQTLNRSSIGWIGYKEQHPNSTTDIINHQYCPLGYCINKPVVIHTTRDHFDQDVQCAQHRTGLLCGRCKANYSLGFGSSQCLPRCRSELQFLRVIGLIAVCGVAGILLVVLLTLLNLTVAEGTLNGLIFYANVVQVNSDLFFPPETHSRPWTAFIAWLNLDFGVTVCFYDGMDAYTKTWLQFIFPLYIWLISGAIVYFSRQYNRVAQSMGKNAVKVLATLFLLSFGKLIRTVIAAVTVTEVYSYNLHFRMLVWLPDANIHYLHGRHIILWIVGVLTGVLAFLYALILTFIQCLRRAPNNRMFVWVRRLKPLLDAYTGPYKDRYHFWTGLLLLVRIFLFIAFALNYRRIPVVNFTWIIIVSTILMIAIQPGIYRNQLNGILESSLYVNLILFSALMAACSQKETKLIAQYETIVVFFFNGWALLTFVGIVVYHLYKQCFDAQNCRQWCKEMWECKRKSGEIQPVIIGRNESEQSEASEDENDQCEMSTPSWSTPHIREPLIETS